MRTRAARLAIVLALALGALGCGAYDEASDTGTTVDPGQEDTDGGGGY